VKIRQVEEILESFVNKEITEEEALKSLQESTPSEIYLAEVDLLESGISMTDLKKMSEIYPELLKGGSEELVKTLDNQHPIRDLITEHERINSLLLLMDKIADRMEKDGYQITENDIAKLEKILKNFGEISKHQRREEEVIFPRMKDMELRGRTILLTEEHDDFRKSLEMLRQEIYSQDIDVQNLLDQISFITYNLRFHTFIENDMLYPVVVKKLDDWDDIKKECDKIGLIEFEMM